MGENDVPSKLNELGLSEYAPAFAEQGYDDWGVLAAADCAGIRDLATHTGMRPGHLLKLKAALGKCDSRHDDAKSTVVKEVISAASLHEVVNLEWHRLR